MAGDFSVHVDASAALGMLPRRGMEQVRHSDTRRLWEWEGVARRGLAHEKIEGIYNPADFSMKHVTIKALPARMSGLACLGATTH